MKTNLEKLKSLMDAAYLAGFGHTQNAFAELVKADRSNLSCMMTGKIPVTDAFLRRVVIELQKAGVGYNIQKREAYLTSLFLRASPHSTYCSIG